MSRLCCEDRDGSPGFNNETVTPCKTSSPSDAASCVAKARVSAKLISRKFLALLCSWVAQREGTPNKNVEIPFLKNKIRAIVPASSAVS
jgi:hypothetical protein